MYKPDMDFPVSFKCPLSQSGVLMESNSHHLQSHPQSSPQRQWLHHISESSRRRAEALLIKQRKEKLRKRRMVKRMEYQRLRNMVPSIAAKPLVSKVTVIEEAIRYIDYLHSALLTRLRTKGLPNCLRGVDVDVNQLNLDDIKELVCQLVQRNKELKRQQSRNSRPSESQRQSSNDSPVSFFERSRHVPSYLTAKRPLPKRT